MHLISLPLQLPEDRHVLVTFPVKLVYPVWQENEQFDPYVLVQGTVNGTALGGVVNWGQLITENEEVTVYSRHQARAIFTAPGPRYYRSINLLWHTGIGLSQNPGGLLPMVTHVNVDEPFTRWPISQEKLHVDPKWLPQLLMRKGPPGVTLSDVQLITGKHNENVSKLATRVFGLMPKERVYVFRNCYLSFPPHKLLMFLKVLKWKWLFGT